MSGKEGLPLPEGLSWMSRHRFAMKIKRVGSGLVLAYRRQNLARLRESDGGLEFIKNIAADAVDFWGDDRSMYIMTEEELIHFDFRDQEVKWREKLSRADLAVSDGNAAFVFCRVDGVSGLFAIQRDGGGLWNRKMENVDGLFLDEKYLYVIRESEALCLEKTSGDVMWSRRLADWDLSPLERPLEVVVCRSCMEIVLFKAKNKLFAVSRGSGEKIWEKEVAVESRAESGREYVVAVDEKEVRVMRTGDGGVCWKKENSAKEAVEFEVFDGKLYLQEACEENAAERCLSVYDLKSGKSEWRYESGRVSDMIMTETHFIFVSPVRGIFAVKRSKIGAH
ncbi:MAG: PQQ-binding-like beta-propeller repeat protein [Deltaproteobacteria bacterium]|nr:PQQ-binding-like beta-propeller repeat protein [Deltaproteobacteria bacterium]